MLEKILPFTRCPRCMTAALETETASVVCPSCKASFSVQDGVLDLLAHRASEVITPFQRVMQTSAVVAIYERIWRRLGYYLASSRSFDREMGTVLDMQRRGSGVRVLDLACGPGIFTSPLAKQSDGVVVGLDLSWPMLRSARRRIKRDGLRNVVLIHGSAFHLPFVTGTFTYVNCCGALHLFDRPDQALDEMERVLGPGGHLCAQTTIRPGRSAGVAFLLERFIRFGFFDESDLRERVCARGLTLLESERHRISFTFLARKGALNLS